jgi:cytochrome c biogenesis protein
VLWVYIGFVLMLLGLYPAFFMSHRKIWVYVDQNEGTTRLLFAGSSNKHASTFEKTFAALTDDFQQEQYVK